MYQNLPFITTVFPNVSNAQWSGAISWLDKRVVGPRILHVSETRVQDPESLEQERKGPEEFDSYISHRLRHGSTHRIYLAGRDRIFDSIDLRINEALHDWLTRKYKIKNVFSKNVALRSPRQEQQLQSGCVGGNCANRGLSTARARICQTPEPGDFPQMTELKDCGCSDDVFDARRRPDKALNIER
ncbi:hypothetical protein CEXT_128691 [Caerostris extrusa]|uniref:Uncharacterized protein n=1 Tax=Caerostris extrusa TaxID=172846 RepID=A0AAV4V5D5_CAEEX|nr:hypothetical protein CEXT_128691 [Caerostris extrusa]